MALRLVNFRWDEEFIARVDAAAGDVSRARFVRRAVERALADDTQLPSPAGRSGTIARGTSPSLAGSASARGASGPSAPAEQPPRSSVVRPARSFAKRGVGPVPKGKG